MNLYDVLLEINNFFVRDYECIEAEITTTKIIGSFNNNYVAGQYIRVLGSILNDGVYKITNVTGTELTLDATLQAETERTITVYGLVIPSSFITLANEIIAKGSNEAVASESVSRYSVTYGEGGKSWASVYKKSLDRYRKMRW